MYLYSYIASPVRFIGLFFSKFLLPEDQKGDVVEATDKKEAEEEDIDAPGMPIAIETPKIHVEAAASNDFFR